MLSGSPHLVSSYEVVFDDVITGCRPLHLLRIPWVAVTERGAAQHGQREALFPHQTPTNHPLSAASLLFQEPSYDSSSQMLCQR